jgi:hypothetical protein
MDRLSLGIVHLNVARLVGANIPPKVFDPPIKAIMAKDVMSMLIDTLVEEAHCDVVSIGPVSEQFTLRAGMSNVGDDPAKPRLAELSTVNYEVFTVFPLPHSFKSYMDSLSQNERRNRQHKINLLNKEFNVAIDVLTAPSMIEKEFLSFVEMHTRQWQHEGRPGHFKAWPDATAFNLRLAKSLAERGMCRLIKISANGVPIIYQYAFVLGDCCYWQLPARTIGEEWNRYSLGATAMVLLIQRCIEEGLSRIEGGLGHFGYKLRLGAKASKTVILRFTSVRITSRTKALLGRALLWGMTVLYHKIWYRRVQPRLPARFRFPIWEKRIRLSF